jgi:protein ImuB
LRLEQESAEALYHLGIETIGQLLALPRESLPARFGPMILTRIDQALGRIAEPLVPLSYDTPVEVRMDFDGAIDSLEAIWTVFKQLIGQIILELIRRGCGARRLELEFHRSSAPTISRSILLSRPSRDPVNLFNLMRCALEAMEGDTQATKGRSRLAHAADPDSNIPAGFTAIRLAVPVFEPLAEDQILLLEQEEHNAAIELDRLIERLVLRLGEEAVVQVKLMESYLPERAYVTCAAGDLSQEGPHRGTAGSAVLSIPQIEQEGPAQNSSLRRPLCLLSMPRELRVMVAPSHDRDGRPISFTEDGQVHRITQSIGPERIAGQWWEGHFRTRDYFTVETETGRRCWIFRVQETGKWYLHGEFE